MQHNKYIEHPDVKMYCATNQFPELQFIRPHKKPHGERGLGKYDHMRFDTKQGHGIYAIRVISCACTTYNYSLKQPWITGLPSQYQLHY